MQTKIEKKLFMYKYRYFKKNQKYEILKIY